MQKFWRGLHWKLTLSYTGVTVAALLAVQILASLFVWAIVTNSHIYPRAIIALMEEELVPQIAVYLQDSEPDIQGLTGWLQAAESSAGLTFQSLNFPIAQISLSDFDENTVLLVLDSQSNLLAGIPVLIRENYSDILDQAYQVLEAALAGKEDPSQIAHMIPEHALIVAVPVTGESQQILGILLLKTVYPPRGILVGLLSYIAGSLIFFTIAAGVVGTLFGFITARGLTLRLHRISQATDQWSQGDFSNFIQEHSGDEIGLLTQKLNRMAEQLQNLLHTQQELSAMEERNRLARELHDGVKQQVFATAMQLGAASALIGQDVEAAQEHLDQAAQLTRQTQNELATIIRELRPATLGISGLAPAIREQLDNWSHLNHIAVEVQIEEARRLPNEIEQCLFRVTQEALSNIARHSQATQVKFEMAYDAYNVKLSISDNGKGFDIAAVEEQGVGLRSMRERILKLGGELIVESSQGYGTRLIARCPVSKGEF